MILIQVNISVNRASESNLPALFPFFRSTNGYPNALDFPFLLLENKIPAQINKRSSMDKSCPQFGLDKRFSMRGSFFSDRIEIQL